MKAIAMIKFGLAMATAFAVSAMIFLTEVLYLPSTWSLLRKLALEMIPIAGMLASVLLIFVAATKVDPDDLWSSWWFKYMRGLWGSSFGGRRTNYFENFFPYVDMCRAFKMSTLTILLWFADFGIFALFIHWVNDSFTHELVAGMQGGLSAANFAFAGFVCMFVALIGFFLSWVLLHKTPLDRPVVGIIAALVLGVPTLVIFLVVIPLQFMSIGFFLEQIEIGFVWTVGIIFAALVLVGLVVGIFWKAAPFVGHHVFGALSGGFIRSFKDKTCVIIRSKHPEDE